MIEPRHAKPVDLLSYHHAYGWAVYILVGIVIAIGMLGRLFSFISYKLEARNAAATADLPPGAKPAARKQGLWSKTRTYYRRFISVPATFGRHHMRPVGSGWFSVPTRLQAIMIFAYVAINVIFSFTDYRIVEGKPKSVQLAKELADRAGIMAFYNFPLLFALAGRNDILIWMTGWSYRSMNLFHRWVARISILHAIVHSAGYTWLNRTKLAVKFHSGPFWACATFATVVMCMFIPLSCRPFRTRFYEIFLITHIVLAVALLALLFYHIKVMSGSYNAWLWCCVGIWAFDRLVRFLRIAVLSFRTLKVSGKGRNAVARIADHDSGLIRLSVDSSVALNPSAGAYYFLYTPWSSSPWQSHPFSLASWEPSASGSGTTLHFLIAPRGGATRRLQRRIENFSQTNDQTAGSTSNEVPLRVLLEGPYGSRHPVARFDSILLVAGGTGITAMLPYVFELARRGHKNVSLAWIVKDRTYAEDVLARELSEENRGFANINVFVSSSGKLVRLDSEERFESVGEKAAKILDNDSSDGHSNELHGTSADSHSTSSTACNTRVGTPVGSPIEGTNPFANMSPIDKKLNTGDLMAHLVMKKQFLSAASRSASYASNVSSSASTVCDYDEVDRLNASMRTKVNSADSHSNSGHSTASSTSTLRYVPGRPAMRMLVNRALDQVVGDERLAVMGCGPWSMMDDLRSTIAESYGTGDGQVSARQLEYFEDAFEW